jgi:hypothetical protein
MWATIWSWLKGSRSLAAGLVTGALACLALVGAVPSGSGKDTSDARLGEDPGIAPAEYLYLDNARVLAYLSQVAGGLTESEERSITQTRSLEAGVQNGGFKAGGSAQKQSFVKQVVTPTATSNYFRLLDKLQDRTKDQGRIVELSAAQLADDRWREISEGAFVKVKGVQFKLPRYAADYFFLRRSGSPRLRRFGDLAETFKLDAPQREQIHDWLERFGKNPRIAFNFEIPRRGGPVQMLVPTQYAALADEQSLITGGSLTLVGKVVRKVETRADSFVDAQTLGLFAPALGSMPRFLIDRKREAEKKYIKALRQGSRDPGAAPELRAPRRERLERAKRGVADLTSRSTLARSLNSATRLDRAGLVVIPVAIYK